MAANTSETGTHTDSMAVEKRSRRDAALALPFHFLWLYCAFFTVPMLVTGLFANIEIAIFAVVQGVFGIAAIPIALGVARRSRVARFCAIVVSSVIVVVAAWATIATLLDSNLESDWLGIMFWGSICGMFFCAVLGIGRSFRE